MLNQSDIKKIAWLARLEMAEEDTPGFSRDLSNILNLVEQMDQIDTSSVTPMAHPLELSARLRPDKVTETNQREQFQSHAPAVERGHYLVPKVIE